MRQTLRQGVVRGNHRKSTSGKNNNLASSSRQKGAEDGQGEVEASPTIISLLEGILSD